MVNARWCMHSASAMTGLPLHPHANSYEVCTSAIIHR